jgi:hypothetical protein
MGAIRDAGLFEQPVATAKAAARKPRPALFLMAYSFETVTLFRL